MSVLGSSSGEFRSVLEAPLESVGNESDWEFCVRSLEEVSRTFALPIALLRSELKELVTCGYLLCRVADTVEDHPSLPLEVRDDLFRDLLLAVEQGAGESVFVQRFRPWATPGDPCHGLCLELGRVLGVFRSLPVELTDRCTPWIGELARGMGVYAHRPLGDQGVVTLHSMGDLERYCYFVAGTVGHLLTEAFVHVLAWEGSSHAAALRSGAEEFGLALQLTNILKDVAEDGARGVCFVPRSMLELEGLDGESLFQPGLEAAAHRCLAPIFERAWTALDHGFEYVSVLPVEERDLRLFCLLPLWMAAKTLSLIQHDDRVLNPQHPVKMSRRDVMSLIQDCESRCDDRALLASGWAQLRHL